VPAANFHKGFVMIDNARLHYVRSGNGPAVVLLHASPNSARIVRPLQEIFGTSLTTFAFDLPGYGLSEPVPGEVTTSKVADRIAEGMKALGITKAVLYGRHTGASIAVELSIRHPDLASFVLCDGFPLFGKKYSDEDLADYFQIPTPVRDGGHLIWSWYRCREQYLFWPWNKPGLTTRADRGLPDAEYLHRSTVEFLEAGENLPAIYASAFRYDGRGAFHRLKVPVCFGNRPGDSQFKTMPTYPENLWTKEFPRDNTSAALEERKLLVGYASEPAPEPISASWTGNSLIRDYTEGASGQSYVVAAGLDLACRPLLIVPSIPGSHVDHQHLVETLGQHRPVATFDPRGFGESPLDAEQALTPELWAKQAIEIADALGWKNFDLLVSGTGVVTLPHLWDAAEARVGKVHLLSPAVAPKALRSEFAANYAPDITPSSEGAHLLRLWHHLRDQELFWPAYRTTHEARRTVEPSIEPAKLQERALPLLKQPRSYAEAWSAVWNTPILELLARIDFSGRAELLHREEDIFLPLLVHAEGALGLPRTSVMDANLAEHLRASP